MAEHKLGHGDCPACQETGFRLTQQVARLGAELKEAREENERLTLGFEQPRQSLTVMQPEYGALKEKLAAVQGVTDDLDGLAQRFKDEGGPKLEVAKAVWAWVTRYNRILKGGD